MAPSVAEPAVFRIPVRVGRRRLLALVVNAMGLVVAAGLVGWGMGEALRGTRTGLLTGLGLLVTAGAATYLYLPTLLDSGRGVRRRGVDRLRLDADGITVQHGSGPYVDARLAWADCAAVVSSALPMPHGQVAVYVQFVASRPEAVGYPRGDLSVAANARVLAVPEPLAAMTCLTPYRRRRELGACVAWVREHHPEVRVVGSGSAQHLVDGDPGGGGTPLREAVEGAEVAGGGEAGDEQSGQAGLEAR
jgi:hypothetical protein